MVQVSEVEWLRTAANDLNNILQEISGFASLSEPLAREQPELHAFIESLIDSSKRATQATRTILEHLQQTGPSVSQAIVLPPNKGGIIFETDPRLPALESAEANLDLEALSSLHDIQVANITGEGELILLVDDESQVCLLAKLMLCDEGYKVVTASHGDEAIGIYAQLRQHISLVILDFIMPGVDGETVFSRLKEIDPNVAVVLSSGFAEQTKLSRMLANGLCGFIAKPYTQQRLLEQVRYLLDALSGE